MIFKSLKKNKYLALAVFACSLPFIAVALFMARGIHDRNVYKDFLIDFDHSISYSLKKGDLTAEVDGVKTHVTKENIKSLYFIIFDADFTYYNEEIPESEKVLYIDFGTGDEMWITAYDSSAQTSPMIVKYIKVGSEEYTYMTFGDIRFENMSRLVSQSQGNELSDS